MEYLCQRSTHGSFETLTIGERDVRVTHSGEVVVFEAGEAFDRKPCAIFLKPVSQRRLASSCLAR